MHAQIPWASWFIKHWKTPQETNSEAINRLSRMSNVSYVTVWKVAHGYSVGLESRMKINRWIPSAAQKDWQRLDRMPYHGRR